jgi:hypothetical protein
LEARLKEGAGDRGAVSEELEWEEDEEVEEIWE